VTSNARQQCRDCRPPLSRMPRSLSRLVEDIRAVLVQAVKSLDSHSSKFIRGFAWLPTAQNSPPVVFFVDFLSVVDFLVVVKGSSACKGDWYSKSTAVQHKSPVHSHEQSGIPTSTIAY
jgi:hypothetical protein